MLRALCVGILCCAFGLSYAQTSADDALALSRQILLETPPPLRSDIKIVKYQNRGIRNQLINRLVGRNSEDLNDLLNQAHDVKLSNFDVFEAFGTLKQNKIADFKSSSQYSLLVAATESQDWQRANLANVFLALYYVEQEHNLPALSYAQAALSHIPAKGYNSQIGDFLYDTYDVLNTVFLYDRNITKAVEASELMVQHGKQAGRAIDPVGISYNLSILFTQNRDYETATQLSEFLVKASKSGTPYQQALANLAHGKNLVSMQKFAQSIPFLKAASGFAPNTLIDTSAKAKRALSYAKTGEVKKAGDLIIELQNIMKSQPALSERLLPMIAEIKIEIAAQEGNYAKAFALQKAWANSEIQKLESLADEDRRKASEQLAINEQVVQSEFKNLQEKTKLQADVIVQERRFRYALTGLLAALALITVLLVLARIKQGKVNKQLSIAAEQAKAGEESKARFLAVISHELRTPMNPIIALSQIVCDRMRDEENRKFLSLIRISAENLMTMIENIVAVADDTDEDTIKHLDKVSFKSLLTDTTRRFYSEAVQKGLRFEMRYDRSLEDHVMVNKTALKLVLNNILSNAVKFTQSGYIALRVGRSEANENEIVISVRDSGIGMKLEEIPHLLTAFEQRDSSFTRQYGGTGIGLYVASKKMELLEGRMTIDSTPDKGTLIKIFIPSVGEVALPVAA